MSDAPRWLERLADGSLEDVEVQEVDALVVPSGHLVACDPLVFLPSADPFARAVKPGKHKLSLGRRSQETVFAMLRFSRGAVARWEVARCPGEEDVEGWPGYGVDSGVGCFADRAAIESFLTREDRMGERIAARAAADGVKPDDGPAFQAALERHRQDEDPDPLREIERVLARRPVASVVLDPESGANLVAFRSGPGDGVYASFWGLGKKGQPIALVTDFGLLEPDEEGDDDEVLEEEEEAMLRELFDDEEPVSMGDLAGLEALAAALGAGPKEPEPRQGPSPLFLQALGLVERWIAEEKIMLEPDASLDAFSEAFLEKLVSLSGHRHPGAHVAEWLLDRPEVADVFATDEELEADLTPS